jgi:hypothetical protein
MTGTKRKRIPHVHCCIFPTHVGYAFSQKLPGISSIQGKQTEIHVYCSCTIPQVLCAFWNMWWRNGFVVNNLYRIIVTAGSIVQTMTSEKLLYNGGWCQLLSYIKHTTGCVSNPVSCHIMKHFATQNTCPIFHWDTVDINGQWTLLILRLTALYTFSTVLTQNDQHITGTCNICGVECPASRRSNSKTLHIQGENNMAEV